MNSMVDFGEIDLLVGESPYVPKALLRILAECARDDAAGRYGLCHRYADERGVATLRAAISRRYKRLHQVQIDPESQVLITQGATQAIGLSISSLTEMGDDVLIVDPTYFAFKRTIHDLNRRAVRVRGRDRNAARATLGEGLSVSAFPLDVPV